MNKSNYRQIKIMLEKIHLFEQEKIDLETLVSDLRALLDCLQEINDKWVNNIYSEWFVLEQVHSVALDQGGIHTVENGEKFIRNSLNKIKEILADKLD
ncbi:MAG: hypothetical protein S4CHLAM81_15440 [Chlamydiales bacterium]|nr:hypothetical protein [Chlamydiales bacterium]